MANATFLLAPLIAIIAALLAGYPNVGSIARTIRVFGVLRQDECSIVKHGLEAIHIPDTPSCEDLHHHASSGLIFTACEPSTNTRHSWFPPLALFDDPASAAKSQGTIVTIDPQTLKPKRLQLKGFSGPFVTHGIDVIDDPARTPGEAVYVFAVNHRPNTKYDPENKKDPGHKADSVVEIFHYEIGQESIRHVRTVKHDLMHTPNDIVALSPSSFLVTNDHFYREGGMRALEDLYYGATWSTTVYAEFSADGDKTQRDTDGVKASVALSGLHNNNGLGRGRTPEEIVLASAVGGTVHMGELKRSESGVTIQISDMFEIESTIDNPFYFKDPYANATFDASGFVLAGLSRAINLANNIRSAEGKDGVMVWHAQHRKESESATGASEATKNWEAKLLLHDNGDYIRTASAAALIPIDPSQTHGRREAWLLVTGFMSKNVLAVKIGL